MSEAAAPQAQSNWRLESWYPDLSKETCAKLKIFYDELSSGNKHLSLVTPKTLPFADAIHFADSINAITIMFADAPQVDEVYDLSTGNGFPGIVGAILFPSKKFIIVYPDDKKIDYLKQCITKIGLTNLELRTTSIEALALGSVKHAITRGLSNISKMILMARKCVVKGGTIYHMKSENWSMEVADIPTQLCSVWSPALVK